MTGRDQYKQGDKCVYIPIDSVLPAALESVLFPPDSKVKLSKSRVKTAKIRGVVSQGMVCQLEAVGLSPRLSVGEDVTAKLGITKYEPPKKAVALAGNQKNQRHQINNPHFRKYTDLEHMKNYPTVFAEGEEVVVSEKLHGTNFRAGWVPYVPVTRWEKIKAWFGYAPEREFVYGSRNLQLSRQFNPKVFYDTNVYLEMVKKYDLYSKIPDGYVVYGEVIGGGIQPGYHYGCTADERKLVIFDVMHNGQYIDTLMAHRLATAWGLEFVPMLYAGPFKCPLIKHLATGPSEYAPSQLVREGVVVRPRKENISICGRKILKLINDDYLLSKHADEEVAHDQAV